MKSKILFVVSSLLVSSSLLLSGCFDGSTEEVHVDIDHAPQITVNGLLKKQTGLYLDLPGTHYLEREGEKNLAITSLGINLDDGNYVGNEVEIKGKMKESDTGGSFLDLERIEVTKKLEVKWEDYKSNKLGFSIKYKSNWEIDGSNENALSFLSPGGDSLDIVQHPLGEEIALVEAVATEVGPAKASAATNSKIGVDQLDSLKVTFPDEEVIIYYVERSNYFYIISFDGNLGDDAAKHRNTFHEMLAEFRFIPIDESAADISKTSLNSSDNQEQDSNHGAIFSILQNELSGFSEELSGDLVSAEFVGDKHVFIVTASDDEKVRKLFSYTYTDDVLNKSELLATYTEGDFTDWVLDSGSGISNKGESSIYKVSDSGEIDTTLVKEGFRFFESKRFGFKLQYPSSWYFAGRSDSNEDVIYHYGFSNKPVEDSNELISVDIMKSSLGQFGTALFVDIGNDLQVRVSSGADEADLRNEMYDTIELIN